jgi:hypothetical protein
MNEKEKNCLTVHVGRSSGGFSSSQNGFCWHAASLETTTSERTNCVGSVVLNIGVIAVNFESREINSYKHCSLIYTTCL